MWVWSSLDIIGCGPFPDIPVAQQIRASPELSRYRKHENDMPNGLKMGFQFVRWLLIPEIYGICGLIYG